MRNPARALCPVIGPIGAAALVMIVFMATPARAADDLPTVLQNAERAQHEGRLGDASALYERAMRQWPQDQAAVRGFCEVGIAIAGDGVLNPAVGVACHRIFLATQAGRDLRNKAAALLAAKARPDLDAVAMAALLADAAMKQASDKPWGALARHDIARRLQRADLLAASRSDLQRFGADDPLVRAALEDDVGRAPRSVWLVRLLVLLGLLGTALHAVAHRRRDPREAGVLPASKPIAALVALFAVLASSTGLAAPADMPVLKDKFGQLSPYTIDDAHPELAVKALLEKSKDPLQLGYLLQDLAVRADDAALKHDNARAARYYHALAVAAPTPYGPRKECEALEAIGDIPNAIRACRELLQRQGVVASDYVHFVDVVLKNPKALPELEPKELEGVIAHLETQASTNLGNLPTILRCKVALRFEDPAALEACSDAMSSTPANDPAVISIKWGLAVRRDDKSTALVLVERGRRAGMAQDTVLRMLDTTNAMGWRRYRKTAVVGGLALLLMAGVLVAFRALAASRHRTADRSPA